LIEFPAAIETCDRAPDPADAREILPAPRASVEITPGSALNRKGQRMGASFIGDAEVAAGFSPFDSMRRDAAAARAELGEQMRQLVPESPIDLLHVVLAQTGIQGDQVSPEIRSSRSAEKSRIPFHLNGSSELAGVERTQHFPRFFLEREIAAEDDEHRSWRKSEIELFKRVHRFPCSHSFPLR
jgi:hypothetical protein